MFKLIINCNEAFVLLRPASQEREAALSEAILADLQGQVTRVYWKNSIINGAGALKRIFHIARV